MSNPPKKVTTAPAPPRELTGRGLAPVSKAPPPIRPVAGGYSRPLSRVLRTIPHDAALGFPRELRPAMHLVILESAQEFGTVENLRAFCLSIVAKLSVGLIEWVSAGNDPNKAIGAMESVCHSVLVYNCDRDSERYSLKGEIAGSKEWRLFLEGLTGKSKAPSTFPNAAKSSTSPILASPAPSQGRLVTTTATPSKKPKRGRRFDEVTLQIAKFLEQSRAADDDRSEAEYLRDCLKAASVPVKGFKGASSWDEVYSKRSADFHKWLNSKKQSIKNRLHTRAG